MKINHKISLLSIVILFAGGACSMPYFAGKKAIHIAFVAGLSGENALNGKSLVEGARLYVDRVNRQGALTGAKSFSMSLMTKTILKSRNKRPLKSRNKIRPLRLSGIGLVLLL
ncbi:MAG: hypothetical protein DRR08_04345 [Candidatus Parabeggiatoa sp. nov. 2]|nr:MAG: hypothetical protein DRR08_04345 [Gammaproteobacteria bacterium]